MKKIEEIIRSKNRSADFRNKNEFQAYGNRLAEEFGDLKHRALYIKLAKTENRALLERAREFVMGQDKAVTKGRLFMWKLSELKKEQINTDK